MLKRLTTQSLLFFFFISVSHADDFVSVGGRLALHGVEALDEASVKENPSLLGRLKLTTSGSMWRFHSWLEGGWDGTVRRPVKDHSLFKNYDQVYQDNTPYLEFKELFEQCSYQDLDLKFGIQRFAWGRLDEYPVNDLFNPWDYTRFLLKPLEDRKIGVPSVSGSLSNGDWVYEAVWIPWFVPYRLPLPNQRWAGNSTAGLAQIPNVEIVSEEPSLPPRTIENSAVGMRARHMGEMEWALNLFHGYDPRPVFRSTAFVVTPLAGKTVINPGIAPSFHRITSIGLDGAAVRGDWSIRAEAAYTFNRFFNTRRELWGYPAVPVPGAAPLNAIEQKNDTLDYGIGMDYRLFEDGLMTIQAQQTVIFGKNDALYERTVETIIWANLRIGWMNQKVETNLNIAYNPEHGSNMSKANAYYTFSDAWKAGLAAVFFNGPAQSLFGGYARNDQVEAEVLFSW